MSRRNNLPPERRERYRNSDCWRRSITLFARDARLPHQYWLLKFGTGHLN